MSDGRCFRAPLVISDAGAPTPSSACAARSAQLDSLPADLRTLTPSTSHASLYMDFQPDAALGLTGTNLWIYPSFDHDANVERFARDLDAPMPGVYISFPSPKNPDFQRRLLRPQHHGNAYDAALAAVRRLTQRAGSVAAMSTKGSRTASLPGCEPKSNGRCLLWHRTSRTPSSPLPSPRATSRIMGRAKSTASPPPPSLF